ncbi:hypothetical protein PW5551_07600 [Petrotoga sp. 9PW.55.5.1]|uniref:hypothetical protein n=1 Tax=Petrotoga sp. 9PW.55.5.1 TaxID=1308979 RepID=UPI000DC5B8E9|nr:hypothetical protein [Petrotoga sp. 9PW.55.5.1]RAO98779.1 hypothetical protein PW5551_07600 [Petrotoga sp. 9PW.55.5.1]
MKKATLFVFLLISFFAWSQNYTFIFKDTQLHYVTTNENSFTIPERFQVLWVSNADSWKLDKVYKTFPFRIISLEDYNQKYIQEIGENIYKVLNTNEVIFYNSQIGEWCVTNEQNLDKIAPTTKVQLENPKNAVIALMSEGSWKIVYEMRKDGTFIKNVEIKATPVGLTNLYLVNEYLNLSFRNYIESTKVLSSTRMEDTSSFQIVAEEAILSQTYTMNFGKIDLNSNLFNFRISQNDILSYEDRNVINFSLNSNTKNFLKTNIIRYVENDKYNGMGIELPSGEVWIHEEFDKESFPIKLAYINDTPIGDTLQINLGQSWDIQYKIEKLSDIEVKSAKSRIVDFNITVKNFSDETKIVNLISTVPNIEIENIKIDGNYRNLKNKSEKGKIDIVFDIIDEVSIRLTVKTVLSQQ